MQHKARYNFVVTLQRNNRINEENASVFGFEVLSLNEGANFLCKEGNTMVKKLLLCFVLIMAMVSSAFGCTTGFNLASLFIKRKH